MNIDTSLDQIILDQINIIQQQTNQDLQDHLQLESDQHQTTQR
jgi:hypothetical protein